MGIVKSIHANRWFIWAIMIIFVVGLTLLYGIQDAIMGFEDQAIRYVYQPVRQWKNFMSVRLGISIDYPPTWQIETSVLEPDMVTLENPANFDDNITVSKIKPEFEKIIRDSIKSKNFEEKPVSVDGIAGAWLENKNSKDAATENIIFFKVGKYEYYLAGSAKQFAKIIASIKFLQQ